MLDVYQVQPGAELAEIYSLEKEPFPVGAFDGYGNYYSLVLPYQFAYYNGEVGGGRCSQCGKIVCRHHFLRGWFKGRGRVCSRCLVKPNENRSAPEADKKFSGGD